MQQIQINNLLQLIRTSGILDAGERQEWLQLVGVMNERQLVELQRILESAHSRPAPNTSGVIGNGIPLSHILNVPGSGLPQKSEPKSFESAAVERQSLVKKPPVVPLQPKNPIPDVQPIAQKQPVSVPKSSRFAGMLRNLLGEKELIGRKEPELLELPAHATPDTVVLSPAAGKIDLPTVHFPENTAPLVPQPNPRDAAVQKNVLEQPQIIRLDRVPENATINIQNSVVSIGSQAPVRVSAKKVVEGDAPPKAAILNRPNIPQSIRSDDFSGPKKNIFFKTGLEHTDMLLQAKLQNEQEVEVQEEALLDKIEEVKPQLPEFKKDQTNIPVETLSDVAQLSVRIWRVEDHEAIKRKIVKLITHQEFHDVIQNLEQSPLYAAYLKTGVKLLQDNISFEQLNSQTTGITENYLSREEFEGFTDMLRQVQASS